MALAAVLLPTFVRGDPVLVEDHFEDTHRGPTAGVPVSVVDATGFAPGTHGQRITDLFVSLAPNARLAQRGGWGWYRLDGVTLTGTNSTGYVRHALEHDRGVFFTATDNSPVYSAESRNGWVVVGGRPFTLEAQAFAAWMETRNVLFVASVENNTVDEDGRPIYCDDYHETAAWIPLCGQLDDYIAHSGVGLANTVFVGALDRDLGGGAIRSTGVFAPNTLYVESPDGSTSQATPVLAAYAARLAAAHPDWSAAQLKRELMHRAREETLEYFAGLDLDRRNALVTEPRTLQVLRPDAIGQETPTALTTSSWGQLKHSQARRIP